MSKNFTGGKRNFATANGNGKESYGEKPRKNFITSEGKKDFKPKNRDWDSESEDEETKKNQIEAKHNQDNMKQYIKNAKTIEILNKRGITYLFPIQEHCFQAIQAGKDLIGKDRTGSGKTLGFSLPLIEKLRNEGNFTSIKKKQTPYMLVVVPTRELCIQVANEINTLKHSENEFRVLQIYGGVDVREQANQIRDGVEIVVGTPGRIIDQYERGALMFHSIVATVLDEADQMLNFGFQEDIEKIFGFIKNDKGEERPQNLLFSATMPSWVHDIARKFLREDRVLIDLVKNLGNKTSQDVTHLAINCPYFQRTEAIGDVILCYGGGAHSRVIIFCETKNEANEIMLKANIKQDVQVLHGDIPQKQREITFQGFREGKFKCLVATNVAARGLDIPEVDLIVQLEPPKELDAYIHRSGRTGRAGKKGVCITFYTKKQQSLIERIEKKCHIKMQKVGAPQPADLIRASQNDIKKNLMSVNRTVLGIFKEVSVDLIQEFGAEEALERAIAFISGYTEKMKQRSLLCCLEGYVTYIVRTPSEFRGLGYIWGWVKNNFPAECTDRIKGMKKFADNKGAVFDVAEEDKEVFDAYINELAEGTKKGLELEVATSIPEIEEEGGYSSQGYNGGNKSAPNGFSFTNTNPKMDPKLKRELEIFIGGLPYDCKEKDVTSYFDKNGVQFSSLRALSGDDGKFKGIIFAMCANQAGVKKAVSLDGQKFMGRPLRINMACKK
ncbi:hypothetical protein ABPG74_020601 [Tetrahymena malaccensis]